MMNWLLKDYGFMGCGGVGSRGSSWKGTPVSKKSNVKIQRTGSEAEGGSRMAWAAIPGGLSLMMLKIR